MTSFFQMRLGYVAGKWWEDGGRFHSSPSVVNVRLALVTDEWIQTSGLWLLVYIETVLLSEDSISA